VPRFQAWFTCDRCGEKHHFRDQCWQSAL